MIKRTTPEWIEKKLLGYGRNFWGGALFRIIWSDNVMWWSFRDQRMGPRYAEIHCWVLEKWLPASKYGSRVQWEAVRDWDPSSQQFAKPILGPYPRRGDYEPVYKFTEWPSSTALPRDVIELVCRLIEQGKAHTRSERWAAIRAVQEKSATDFDKLVSDYCDDKLRNVLTNREHFGPGQRLRHALRKKRESDVKFDLALPRFWQQNGFMQCPTAMKEKLLGMKEGKPEWVN